jgi:hypothetical protein
MILSEELNGLNFPGASVRAENNRPLQVLFGVPGSSSKQYVFCDVPSNNDFVMKQKV